QRMRYAWNSTLPRRSLSWRTASEAWAARGIIDIDRQTFKAEVQDRAARIRRQLEARGEHAGQAERFAIEATLTKYGWLVRQAGTGCYVSRSTQNTHQPWSGTGKTRMGSGTASPRRPVGTNTGKARVIRVWAVASLPGRSTPLWHG